MKLFYGEIEGNQAFINDEEQQHIVKVLRMKDGEEIHVTDGQGNLASGTLMIEGKKQILTLKKLKATFLISARNFILPLHRPKI
uniref:RNA methyltransferase PUA domain-containing protein n=1 Tax=Chryseobacterium endophyticum TaxID=1854762 RepID=A0AAU6WT21_9FLAO